LILHRTREQSSRTCRGFRVANGAAGDGFGIILESLVGQQRAGSALRDATQAFLAVLDTYSLADLIKPRKPLSSLLLDRRVSLRHT
jgi:hypothetical protein